MSIGVRRVECVVMATGVIVGVFTLAGLVIVCFEAYKIKAESFEFSTGIWKLLSFSIKIRSPEGRAREKDKQPRP